jgi:LPS export ABC transporter protein LptC
MGVDAQEVEDKAPAQGKLIKVLSMKNIRNILIVLALIALGLYCRNIFFGKNKPSAKTIMLSQAEQVSLGETVKSFSISGFSDSGKKAWEMEGKSADIFSDIIDLYDINADSYGDNVKVNLKSDKGIFNRKTNDIRLTNNVRVVTDEGTSLFTEILSWDAREQFVYTEEDVFITRKDMDIYGTGALADPSLKTVQLNHNIKVNTSDPSATITCDGPLEVDYENNVAYFNNNVRLIEKETAIDTDKAQAYFDPKAKSLTKVFCQGNVVIKRGQDITHAQQLTYFPGEGRVMLEGRPRIVISSTADLLQRHKEKQALQNE